jgi:poly(A) polymerase
MFDLSFNFIKKIRRRIFPFYKNKELKFIFDNLQKGFSNDIVTARFVGGCVRKYLTNDEVDDIDIATILSTNEIKERFEKSNFNIIDTGTEHGTVTLVSNQFKLELTTLRKDVVTDGRHAEVEYINDWQLDSERRDFTINAIYLDINGKIFDPQSGTFDLKNNNVKFIGDPNSRIQEDYLRIIRLLRFAIQYDSSNDKTTIEALKSNLNGIKDISKERIFNELMKMLSLKNFDNILKHINKKNIFLLIFSELKYLDRLKKLNKVKEIVKIDNESLLSILLIDETDSHEYFAYKYSISNDLKKKLNLIHKNFSLLNQNENFFRNDLSKNIYLYGKEHLIFLNTLCFTNDLNTKISDYKIINKNIIQNKIQKLPINGKYLIQKGMKEGMALGKVLKTIEEEWINNSFKISQERIEEIIKLNLN